MARTAAAVKEPDTPVDGPNRHGAPDERTPGLVASATRIDGTDRDSRDREKSRRRKERRAGRVWEHYDECGELWYMAEFTGNSFARIRLYAGRREADGAISPIVAPEADQEDADPPPPLTAAERVAVDAVDRLRGASGGQAELMRGFGRLLPLVGDSNLIGYQRPPADGLLPAEVWDVVSTDELAITDRGMTRKTTPGGTADDGEVLPDDAFTLRVWRPHPRWSGLATAPTFAILDRLDELAILSRMIRAQARSRIANAGILVVPSEVDKPRDPTAANGDGGQVGSPFLADMLAHFVTPIADEGSASAVVPYLIKLPAEMCDKVRHFAVDRPIDQVAIAERKELLQRIANGLDLPAEVLTGLGAANHWSAWLLDDNTFRAHLEPLAVLVCNSLTTGYLRPALEAVGLDAAGLVIWYDPSDLVVHPDRGRDAKTCHEAVALSDAALRRYFGFTEDDAPSDEERIQRLALQRGALDPAIVDAIIRRLDPTLPEGEGGDGTDAGPGGGGTAPVDRRPEPARGPPPDGPPAASAGEASTRGQRPTLGLLAAVRQPARPARLATLGRRLANIDRGLMTRLQVEADATVRRSLERAGGRVRTAANARRDRSVQDAIRACATAVEFCARLGPTVVAALGVDEHELLAGSLDQLQPRFDAQVARAQRRALADTAAALDLEVDGFAAVELRQEQDRHAAWTVLLGALTALTAAQLYDPAAGLDDRGEVDAELRVPAGLIRDAMVRAGGAEGLRVDAGTAPAGLVATGTTVGEVLAGQGATVGRMVWDYGDAGARRSTFLPHEQLDGVVFDTWESETLAAPPEADWLASPYLWPGDHGGCGCLWAPLFDTTTDDQEE